MLKCWQLITYIKLLRTISFIKPFFDMTTTQILYRRLLNQQLIQPMLEKPGDIVSWLVAMQAQEYAMAKWAIGLRLPGSTDQQIEKDFNSGAILRTHLMRPTWHFVAPKDIRWMLRLTAPRVHAINNYWYRKLELDKKILKRIYNLLTKVLMGNSLTRDELRAVFDKAKIMSDGLRMGYILMHAELEGLICSGPRKGKQFSYALLDERVAQDKRKLDTEEALTTLCSRYFTSRGPATIKDFVTWSGLSMKDARVGISLMDATLLKENIYDQEYFFPEIQKRKKSILPTFLMPDYDEYGMSYKDRRDLFDAGVQSKFKEGVKRDDNLVFNRMLIVDGQISGTWKRTVDKNKIEVDIVPFAPLIKTKQEAVNKAIKKYCAFVGKSLES
jgi:hypothetical protein